MLTRDRLLRELDVILSLDGQVPPEFAEPWSREHFLFELPGKWRYSMLASDSAGIAAFGIFSVKGEALHAHRMVVRRDLRRRGVGRLLFAYVGRLGVENGYRHVTVKVASCNDAALAWQRDLGARRCGSEGSNVLFVHASATLATEIRRGRV